ncbi:MAG: serine/threonine-protein kinase [Polyangiaceae bacterium]
MVTLKPGAIFARHYEIVRAISAGGMGVVYEVLHLETRRRRALKVMLPHVVTDPMLRDRFALEAIVTAEIESEHLCEIFDAGIDPESDCPFIVMELLRGDDLALRLAKGGRYTPEEVLLYMDQVARALEKTHAAGIVHRDLKPENLFLTKRDDGSPRIKILDFGIAKIVKKTDGGKNTTKPFGTPYYMAREQVTGDATNIGPATDLYSLAQIVFALLVGSPYFEDEGTNSGGNLLTVLMAVGQGVTEAATARAQRRGVTLPATFDAWFQRATSVPPAERFQRATDMIAELRRALDGATIIGPSMPPPAAAMLAGATTPIAPGKYAAALTPDTPARSLLEQRDTEHAGFQTGSAQALPAPAAASPPPRRRGWVIAGVLVAAGAGATVFAVSQRGATTSASASVSSAPPPAESAPASRPSENIVVASTASVAAAPPSAESADAAPSASPSASPGASTARAGSSAPRLPIARPSGGPPATPPTEKPVWEQR